jgi:hypothetical protein
MFYLNKSKKIYFDICWFNGHNYLFTLEAYIYGLGLRLELCYSEIILSCKSKDGNNKRNKLFMLGIELQYLI